MSAENTLRDIESVTFARYSSVILVAAKTLLQSDNYKTFYLNLAGGFTVTIPAPFLGGIYTFVVSTAPTTAYILNTTNNVLVGNVVTSQDAGGSAASSQSGTHLYNFVANQAVVGDKAVLTSDGTSWFVTGFAKLVAGATIA